MRRILVQNFLVHMNACGVVMSTSIQINVSIMIATAQLYNHRFLRRRVHHHHPSLKLPDHQSEKYIRIAVLFFTSALTHSSCSILISHRCPTPRPTCMSSSPPHSSTSRTNYPSAHPSVSQAYDPTHHPTIASL